MIGINTPAPGLHALLSQEVAASTPANPVVPAFQAAEVEPHALDKVAYKPGMPLPDDFEIVTFLSGQGHAKKVVGQRNPTNDSEFQVKDPKTGKVLALLKKTSIAQRSFDNGKPEFTAGKQVWMMAAHTGLKGGAGISNAEEMEDYICENDEINAMMNKPSGKCYDCALLVQNMLNEKNIPHFTRAMYIWNNKNDNCPKTHYVVVAKLDGQKVAIDPTGAQFKDVDANIAKLSNWARDFKSAFSPSTVIKYVDAASLTESRRSVHSFFSGTPGSFTGSEL